LNAKINAFVSSQDYKFATAIYGILLELRVQNFIDVGYFIIIL